MEELIAKGSLGLVYAALLGAGIGLPISEDATLLATGALADRGYFSPLWGLIVCYFGILSGDLAIFTIGRRLGPRMLQMKFFLRLMPQERQDRMRALYERRGPVAVFISRFLIGLRLPGFATAGLLGMRTRTFLLWDALGAMITAPLTFGLGYAFSTQLDRIIAMFESAGTVIAVVVAAVAVVAFVVYRRRAVQSQDDATN